MTLTDSELEQLLRVSSLPKKIRIKVSARLESRHRYRRNYHRYRKHKLACMDMYYWMHKDELSTKKKKRYYSDSEYREKIVSRALAWEKSNPEQRRATDRAYYAKNLEKRRAQKRESDRKRREQAIDKPVVRRTTIVVPGRSGVIH